MPYRYREDIALADAAFEAWAHTLEELMVEASDATVNVMVEDPGTIRPLVSRTISLGPEAVDMLLYGLLQELVYFKDAEQLLLRVEKVEIRSGPDGYCLRAEARGEKIDPTRHPLASDVKAVTLHRFLVTETDSGWRAFVILDI
ncbi:MAG: archease [Deltaproteobacteria bacterium]